jgi:hypothetical protein
LSHSVDIKNAFVQSDLVEEIYMKQPPCFDDGTGNVYKLNKSLSGLKQAPRVWNQTLAAFLQELGFIAAQSDVHGSYSMLQIKLLCIFCYTLMTF